MSSLRDLYQEIILDHGKQPRNFGELDNATHHQSGHNPLCGDKLTIFICQEKDVLVDIKFKACGCAISVASASLLTESIKGKNIQEFEELFELFLQLVMTGKDDSTLGKLTVFGGVVEFPVRVKCATLAWHTLNAALKNASATVSTE